MKFEERLAYKFIPYYFMSKNPYGTRLNTATDKARNRYKATSPHDEDFIRTSHRKYTEKGILDPEKYPEYTDQSGTPSRMVVLAIPKNISEGVFDRKQRPFSRENMQMNNKKYRDMRSKRYSSSMGIYDIQNDRRIQEMRTGSAQGNYPLTSVFQPEFNPVVTSFRTICPKHKDNSPVRLMRSSTVKNTSNTEQMKKKSNSIKNKHREHTSPKQQPLRKDYSQEIFMPAMQSETGHMIKGFKSNLRKKCIQDNLNIMACVLRRKVKVLDKKQILDYVSKIMSRIPE